MMYTAQIFWYTLTNPDRIIETRFHGSFDDCLEVCYQAPCSRSHWYIYKGDFICDSSMVARFASYFGY